MAFLLTKEYVIKRIVGDTKEGYLVCGLGDTVANYKNISYEDVFVVDSNISYLENRMKYFKKLNGVK